MDVDSASVTLDSDMDRRDDDEIMRNVDDGRDDDVHDEEMNDAMDEIKDEEMIDH